MERSAGWYPDPLNDGHLRWWDGSEWTAYVVVPEPTPPESVGALILGLFGFAGMYVPFVGFCFAVPGAALSIVALQRRRDYSFAITTLSICAFTLALSVSGFIWSIMTGFYGIVTMPAPP